LEEGDRGGHGKITGQSAKEEEKNCNHEIMESVILQK
jgi:hypothetical protein